MLFIAMITGSRVNDVGHDRTGDRAQNSRTVSIIPSIQWKSRSDTRSTSSEGQSNSSRGHTLTLSVILTHLAGQSNSSGGNTLSR